MTNRTPNAPTARAVPASRGATPVTAGANRPVSKTEYVLSRLREEIAAGLMSPGEPIRQSQLAARYGVSETPVREAMRLLESEGVLDYAPHRGATVRTLANDQIKHLYLARTRLEGLAWRIAANSASDIEPVLKEMEAHNEAIKNAIGKRSAAELSAMNRVLHMSIYVASSPLIASFVKNVWAMVPIETNVDWANPTVADQLVTEHMAIIEAVRMGDADRADTLGQAHVSRGLLQYVPPKGSRTGS